MRKIKYLAGIVAAIIMMSCGDDFLDTKNLYEKLDVDYYSTPEEIEEALTGAYASLPIDAGMNNPILISEILSPDRLGGGGSDDVDGCQACDAFRIGSEDLYLDLWETTYEGIFRANMILKRFDNAEYTDENAKNQAHGEAYFLRAFFYLRLAQLFGPVPLITDPAPVNNPKASPEELYGQIAEDLKTAIELMPATRYESIPIERLGHATKWAAEGLMARAFLFYTGYYDKTDIPLPGGGTVTKDDVIGWIDDCVNNSGHGLVEDFRNLWPYTFSNDQYPSTYPYVVDNNLKWVGEEGANIETIFAIHYSPYGGWNAPQKLSYSNQLALYMGIRHQSYYPFGQGWGIGTVNPQLWDSFEPDDIRQQGSILNLKDTLASEGSINREYIWGQDQQFHETGHWQKKYIPVVVKMGADLKGMYFALLGEPDNMQLWNMQDEVLIRFADILLMGAELGSANAQNYLDRVRTRAGLGSVPPTLENIKRERRHELAFEGLRYFDLLRWHDIEAAFAEANNIPVKNIGVDEIYTVTYRPETGGFLPIPESQVRLSNGVMKQNTGWEE
ncbi:MAG: RagB/SusD family nutrient uptake outer membrane protein [Bacteroidales bacterium]|nr:RagB/SusD family nutrient uptake outer membrane protein [Bacteroidales bacterium]MBN2763972.1 RagB/SusD family nutrient uptake outer membrane protein [Bacteroidales bacterium]